MASIGQVPTSPGRIRTPRTRSVDFGYAANSELDQSYVEHKPINEEMLETDSNFPFSDVQAPQVERRAVESAPPIQGAHPGTVHTDVYVTSAQVGIRGRGGGRSPVLPHLGASLGSPTRPVRLGWDGNVSRGINTQINPLNIEYGLPSDTYNSFARTIGASQPKSGGIRPPGVTDHLRVQSHTPLEHPGIISDPMDFREGQTGAYIGRNPNYRTHTSFQNVHEETRQEHTGINAPYPQTSYTPLNIYDNAINGRSGDLPMGGGGYPSSSSSSSTSKTHSGTPGGGFPPGGNNPGYNPPGGGGPGWPGVPGGGGGPGGPGVPGGGGPEIPMMHGHRQSRGPNQGPPGTTAPSTSLMSKLVPKIETLKLNETNWVAWSRFAHAMLLSAGLEWCIHRDCSMLPEDWVAQSLITSCLSENYQIEVSDQTSAFGIWNYLLDVFTVRGRSKVLSLFEELNNLKMNDRERPSSFISRARKIVMALRSFGQSYTDLSVCYIILKGLTVEYKDDVKTLYNTLQDNHDIGRLQGNLELSYIRIQAERTLAPKTHKIDTPKGFKGGYQGRRGGPTSHEKSEHSTDKKVDVNMVQWGRAAVQQAGRSVPVCFHCGEAGHIKPNCPKLQVQASCIESEGNHIISPPSGWLIDTGATDHICPTKECMSDYVPFTKPKFVTVANGRREPILGEGTVTLHFENDSSLKLFNVKHVPSSNKRLFSVGKAYRDGLSVAIDGLKCLIKDSEGIPLIQAPHFHPYWWLIEKSVNESVKSVSFADLHTSEVHAVDVNLWHRRFGHLSSSTLSRMRKTECTDGVKLPQGDLSSMIGNQGYCDVCLSAKMTTAPHRPTANSASQRLDLVHMDLMGPIRPETPDNEKYALTIIDEFSDYSSVVLLNSKADASKEAILVLKQLSRATDSNVKAIRTDGGTEFLGLDKLCRKEGIKHQTTPPYSHQSNGKVERLNRTLQEKARAMLADSDLPTEYWGEAMLSANHVRNLSPTSNSDLTPHELMYGVKPDASHLRVFGCKCKVLTPKTLRTGKFSPVSTSGIFLGYQGDNHDYRVLVDGRVTVCRGKDVRCDESLPMSHSPSDPVQDAPVTVIVDKDAEMTDTPQLSSRTAGVDVAGPTCSDKNFEPCTLPSVSEFELEDCTSGLGDEVESPYDSLLTGIRPETKGVAGSASPKESPCSTSTLEPRLAGMQGVTQVPTQDSVEGSIPNPQPLQVQYDFKGAGVPVTSAGFFGNRYPVRERQKVQANEVNVESSVPSEIMHVQGNTMIIEPPDYCGIMHVQGDTVIVEPSTYIEAVNSPHSEQWIAAMVEEMGSLKALGTWSLVQVSEREAKRALPVRWVFKVKLTEAGEVERFKARLVAKGFKQVYGVDYTEVYAPVSRHATLRYLLSKAVELNMSLHQLDISTAFLHGKLNENVFVQQAPGFYEGLPYTVCKLHKALYGLKQAPKAWYDTMSKVLLDSDFVISDADPSLFILRKDGESPTYVLLYVDDILIASQLENGISEVKALLSSHFSVKDLGPAKYFLGMSISQSHDVNGVLTSIKLSNEKLTSEIVNSFADEGVLKPKAIPLDPSWQLTHNMGEVLPGGNRYRELVGGLMYLANTVRPDIAFATSHLARFSLDPTCHHMRAGISVLRYLLGTKDLGLVWEKGKSTLTGYVDSDYAGELDGRRSTSGHVFLNGTAAISWGSKLQKLAALSTVEAEFISICSGVQEALWLSKLAVDFDEVPAPVRIFSDNTGALANIKGIPISPRTKHIGVRFHRVRQEVEAGSVNPTYVPSAENLADMFTKGLPKAQFQLLRAGIGMK